MARNLHLFFSHEEMPQPEAHLVQIAQCANAAANLGYSTMLAYPKYETSLQQIAESILPKSRSLENSKLREFYSIDSPNLSIAELPIPWPQSKAKSRLTNSSTITCKYYWPLHLKPKTSLVHTRDWNFAKAAIKSSTPVVFECHHSRNTPFEAEFVSSPFLQLAVTVIDSVKENMLQNGMPEAKTKVFPNGYNRYFMLRHGDEAESWRQKLLAEKYDKLIVYAGALYDFKGIDVMLDVAQGFPRFRFVFAGGPDEQKLQYEKQATRRNIQNVKFLGFLEQKALASLLQAADVLAHPHRSGPASTFTSPLKLFDYMASGTPIVATRIQSLKHIEASNAVAAWCDPDSVRNFAECLKQTVVDFPSWKTANQQQIEYVKQFSWENRLSKILSHIEPRLLPHNFNKVEK